MTNGSKSKTMLDPILKRLEETEGFDGIITHLKDLKMEEKLQHQTTT